MTYEQYICMYSQTVGYRRFHHCPWPALLICSNVNQWHYLLILNVTQKVLVSYWIPGHVMLACYQYDSMEICCCLQYVLFCPYTFNIHVIFIICWEVKWGFWCHFTPTKGQHSLHVWNPNSDDIWLYSVKVLAQTWPHYSVLLNLFSNHLKFLKLRTLSILYLTKLSYFDKGFLNL